MLVEQLPELIRALSLIRVIDFVGHRELRAEKKVPNGILVKDSVNQDPLGVALEIDAIILATEAVQGTAIPLDFAKLGSVK
jgi:hypothetical protein